jgi:small subunit ribosomal protein S19
LAKIQKVKSSNKREVIKTYKRASVITPELVGLTIAVHDGRKFVSIFLTENMVGHRLGEFAPTRTFRMHSGQRKTEKGEGSSAPAASAKAPAAGAPKAPASGS